MPKPSHLRSVDPTHAPAPQGAAPRSSCAAVESVPKPGKRRKFSAAQKLRIVREATACTQRGEFEALLRREGIYSSLLAAWRKQLALHGSEALAERKPGRKPKQDAKDRLSSAFKMEERSLGDIGRYVHFENVDPMRRDKDAIMSNNDVPLEYL